MSTTNRATDLGRHRHRRAGLLIATMLAAAATLLTACGSGGAGGAAAGADEPAAATTTAPGTTTTPAAPATGYPVTVATRYGKVTIDSAPQRVVALTVPAADDLISLGVTPVAVAVDPSRLASAFPWMVDALAGLADARLSSASGELNVEAIAATHPDLIVAETWQVTKKSIYTQLSQIAPTVVPDSTALNVDWDVRLRSAAAAVNQGPRADQLITKIKAEFTAVGDAVPDIASKTYQWVRVDADGYGFGNGSVLGLFGLRPAANQDNSQNGPPLSKENTAQLNADLLAVWAPTPELRASLDSDPLFQKLPAVRHKTVFHADLAMADALNSPGPMSLAWLKAKLAPTIRALA